MNETLSKDEKYLFQARTPMDYIDRSLKSRKIPSGRKAMVTRHWLEKTGFTIDDIKKARNRHPYWKKKKMAGTAQRNAQRFEEHDYSTGVNIIWSDALVDEFLRSNVKGKDGAYQYKDWELAKHFKCSIAAIQHMRRKYNMAVRIIGKKSGGVTQKRIKEYIQQSENILRRTMKKLKA